MIVTETNPSARLDSDLLDQATPEVLAESEVLQVDGAEPIDPAAEDSHVAPVFLPQPPKLSDRYLYINPTKSWALLAIFAYICLLSSSCWFIWRTHFWWYSAYVLLVAAWTIPHFVFVLISKNFDLDQHRQIVSDHLQADEMPSVDVFITTCGEALSVIENTLAHAAKLTYQPLKVFVLDDGADPEVERLADRYGITYLSRPNRGHMKKAGNLLYGYHHSHGDLILVLDADFAIAPTALEHMVPWMNHDSQIGILQTPQYFDSRPELTWPALGAAYCQELFYRVIQPARDYLGNSAICVGTNALYRRQALADNGGFYQVPASEDVHNGVALIHTGWKVKYIPILLARGLCPDHIQSLFKQHYRWCSGSMRLITSQFFWGSKMPLYQKLIYLCGACYYPSMGLSLLVTLMQITTMVIWLYEDVHWYVILLFLPKILLMYLVMPLWNQARWGLHSVKAAVTFSWAYLLAIWDLIKGKTEGWIASGSQQKSARYQEFRQLLLGYCILHVLCLTPIVGRDWYNFLPIIASHCFSIFIAVELLVAES